MRKLKDFFKKVFKTSPLFIFPLLLASGFAVMDSNVGVAKAEDLLLYSRSISNVDKTGLVVVNEDLDSAYYQFDCNMKNCNVYLWETFNGANIVRYLNYQFDMYLNFTTPTAPTIINISSSIYNVPYEDFNYNLVLKDLVFNYKVANANQGAPFGSGNPSRLRWNCTLYLDFIVDNNISTYSYDFVFSMTTISNTSYNDVDFSLYDFSNSNVDLTYFTQYGYDLSSSMIASNQYNVGYNAGYREGYNVGNSAGISNGYQSGYQSGYVSGMSYGNTQAYQNGYVAGTEAGISAGYNQGYVVGLGDGFNTGRSIAYESGYDSGYAVGTSAGISIGYQNGYDNGYNTGNNVGYQNGYTSGYTIGSYEGYQSGYSNGYTDASNVDATVQSIFSGFVTVGLLPIDMLLTIFNFEILGINVAYLVTALFTICLTIILIKLFKGSL